MNHVSGERPGRTGEAFKAAMRTLASGVILITTQVGDRTWGVTVTSCSSVSVLPPRVLVSLGSTTVSCRAIRETGRFGVNVLGSGQKEVAEAGSRSGEEKFVDPFCCRAPGERVRSAMIRGALAHVDCRLERAVEVGDHTLIVGDVERVEASGSAAERGGRPLVYFDRAYHDLGARA